jgi:hypothetical protein
LAASGKGRVWGSRSKRFTDISIRVAGQGLSVSQEVLENQGLRM